MKNRKFSTDGFIDAEDSPARTVAIARALALANDPDAMGEGNPKFNMDEFTALREEKPPQDPFAKIPLESKAKPKVVTAEQLQAFKKQYGADKNLTDYMNKQQGLTRRGGSTPSAATPSANAYGKEQQFQRAQEAAKSPEAIAKRKAMEEAQALEASRPELDIAGGMAGASLKTVANQFI
jgi:hypothetical protein